MSTPDEGGEPAASSGGDNVAYVLTLAGFIYVKQRLELCSAFNIARDDDDSPSVFAEEEEEECCVCFEEASEVQMVVLPGCAHSMCADCYRTWSTDYANPTCPMCRRQGLENDGDVWTLEGDEFSVGVGGMGYALNVAKSLRQFVRGFPKTSTLPSGVT